MTVPSFPSLPGLMPTVTRTPSVSTIRQEAISGRRVILPLRSVPRWTWEVSFEFLRTPSFSDGSGNVYTELSTLAAFYNSSITQGTVFGYQDEEDNAVTNQNFGQGDGTTTQFQLIRSWGGFAEPVYLPTTISSLTVAGTPMTQGTDFTVSSTGLITFTVAPANGAALAWSGSFSWMCRFDEDSIPLSRFMYGLWSGDKIKFSSEIAP